MTSSMTAANTEKRQSSSRTDFLYDGSTDEEKIAAKPFPHPEQKISKEEGYSEKNVNTLFIEVEKRL